MLLVSFTKDGTLHRVSIQGHQLAHDWKPFITRMDNVTFATNSVHGGYCRLGYGKIYFTPSMFTDDFPPTGTATVKVEYTTTTEAAATTLFEASAYCSSIKNSEIGYTLFGPEFDETITAASLSTTTLAANMSTILTGISEISTLNTENDRATSPQSIPDNYADVLNIEFASKLAKSFTHLFYIIGSTAYLIDMLGSNGSRTITDHNVATSISIMRNIPIAEITCDDDTNPYPIQSAYTYGRTLSEHIYHTTQANIETALDNIMTVEHEWRITAQIPLSVLSNPLILPREEITFTDYYIHPTDQTGIDITIYPIDIRYNFNKGSGWVTISGDGTILYGGEDDPF